ncbi:MAG: hypothetical protein JNK04_14560 [Myxococcales bacterium]|nr:hypothetical protein [Myxococcales bacterium]
MGTKPVSALKAISKESIPRALDKAERYRLLNEPFLAESICLDVLSADSENDRALSIYTLSLTDQLTQSESPVKRALEAIAKMKKPYDREYYAGIVAERRASAILERSGYGAGAVAWHHIQDAMKHYEEADKLQEDDSNDDAILRYNTCVRLVEAYRLSEPAHEPDDDPLE